MLNHIKNNHLRLKHPKIDTCTKYKLNKIKKQDHAK